MKPFVVEETLFTGEITVAVKNALDYNVDNTGDSDAVPALQAIINEVAETGGGVIYLPCGTYALKTPLDIQTGVTLRGEWDCPQSRGTVITCYYGKDDPDGTPQITMRSCTGLKNVTVYYPEQSIENPIKYSPTIRQNGIDSVNIFNVTLVNPWLGVQCGPDGNELHYLKNVYISPINVGFFMDMTTDIGRMENLNISPDYYADYTGTDIDKVRDYMLKNVTGVYMARSDWEYGYNINIEYCNIGFMITSFKDSGPNTQLSQLKLHNCNVGFKLVNVNPYGVALSDSTITADIGGLYAAIESDSRFKTVMQLNGVDLGGQYEYLVAHKGVGELSFVNCTFSGWDKAAIYQTLGGLSVVQCKFDGNGTHFLLEDGIGGAQIIGNTYSSPLIIKASDTAKKEILYSDEKLGLSIAPRGGHKPYPYKAQPTSNTLYNVDDYGAVRGTDFDNTDVIQKLLDIAGTTGGIVYFPGGWYRFDGSVTVPTGVELRGTYDVPCHTMGGGSVLLSYGGKGDENSTPFISLSEKSGTRGILIYHPEQNPAEPFPYPWDIQSTGKYCYCIDTVFVNPWLGLDFGTYPSEGHYISYISGAPIKCGIFCGNNSGEGWVENIQYNPHYLFRSKLPGEGSKGNWKAFWHSQIKYLDALKFGYNEDEHLYGTFVFAAKHGLAFVAQDGKAASGKFIGHGTDGGENGLYIEEIGDADFINTELVTIEASLTRIYFITAESMTGTARIYNTLMWGHPDYAVLIGGGNVDFQQTNYVDHGKMANVITGGKFINSAAYYFKNQNNFEINSGDVDIIANMTVRRGEQREPILQINGECNERFSWSK